MLVLWFEAPQYGSVARAAPVHRRKVLIDASARSWLDCVMADCVEHLKVVLPDARVRSAFKKRPGGVMVG